MCMANPIISSKAAGKWGLKRHLAAEKEGTHVPWIISYRKTHFLSLDLPTHLQGISLLFKCSVWLTACCRRVMMPLLKHRIYIAGHLWPTDQHPALFKLLTLRWASLYALKFCLVSFGSQPYRPYAPEEQALSHLLNFVFELLFLFNVWSGCHTKCQ